MKAGHAPASNLEAAALDNLIMLFERVSYIYYTMRFKKNQAKIQALIDFNNKINVMILAYAIKLGLKLQTTNIGA